MSISSSSASHRADTARQSAKNQRVLLLEERAWQAGGRRRRSVIAISVPFPSLADSAASVSALLCAYSSIRFREKSECFGRTQRVKDETSVCGGTEK